MTDLLTTRQVQEILRVDRTTIYRMVEGGQLPAVRVGKQWRFAQTDVERWLQNGRYGAPATAVAETEPARAPKVPGDPDGADLNEILPVNCAQAVQDTFADMLGVTVVVTNMQGRAVTQISNPCGFFRVLLSGDPNGWQHCVRTWQQMAGHVALEPRFTLNEMGLMCARGLIRAGAQLKGMVVVGGLAPDNWPPSAEQIAALADLFGVSVQAVTESCDAVYRMDRAGQERALRFVQRMADVFSQMIQDRLAVAQ